MQVLVTGFQRSGTTLLEDLLGKHPQVEFAFHEVGVLKYLKDAVNTKQKTITLTCQILNSEINHDERKLFETVPQKINIQDLFEKTWGEKIPYYFQRLHKYAGQLTIKEYAEKWLSLFKGVVVHIIRHPFDVILSTIALGTLPEFRQPEELSKLWFKYLNKYLNITPLVTTSFLAHPRILTIKYEHLVQSPLIVLAQIYKFCELSYDTNTITQILQQPAYKFGYVSQNNVFKYRQLRSILPVIKENSSDYKRLVDVFELFNVVDGPTYHF